MDLSSLSGTQTPAFDSSKELIRVLCVDDNRDGADALGLLFAALGARVHVTYGGRAALEVATVFRPDLMLIDLSMPDMDGSDLVVQLRKMPAFIRTPILAITGDRDPDRKSAALEAGFTTVLLKPLALTEVQSALSRIVRSDAGRPRQSPDERRAGVTSRLSIDQARQIRNGRRSKTLTRGEVEATIADAILRFQEEYIGLMAERIDVHCINEIVVVRVRGALSMAERQLAKASPADRHVVLIKQTRVSVLECGRAMLESLVHEVAGVKVVSMHHDISTVSGEEIIVFTLAEAPRFDS